MTRTGISALRAPAITTAADFCFRCRNKGHFWTDSTGEPRSCDANHPAAELCHCMIDPAPACSGCGDSREIVETIGKESYCAGCRYALANHLATCFVVDTIGYDAESQVAS